MILFLKKKNPMYFHWLQKSYLRSHKPNIDPKLKFKYYQALKVKQKVEVLEETGPIPEKKDYGDKVHSCSVRI